MSTEKKGAIDRRIYQSRQRLILKGKIVQEKNIYYAYLRKDVQSAYEIVHASVLYFSVCDSYSHFNSVFVVSEMQNGRK